MLKIIKENETEFKTMHCTQIYNYSLQVWMQADDLLITSAIMRAAHNNIGRACIVLDINCEFTLFYFKRQNNEARAWFVIALWIDNNKT